MFLHNLWMQSAVLLTLASLTGCESAKHQPEASTPGPKPVGSAQSTASTSSSSPITVVGDETAPDVASKLAQQNFEISQDPKSINKAGTVVITVDATAGVRDVHRQLVQDLGRNPDAQIVWLYTKMSQIDDKELMDLQQTEALELLEQNKVSATKVRFAVDTEQTTVAGDTLKGWTALENFLSEQQGK